MAWHIHSAYREQWSLVEISYSNFEYIRLSTGLIPWTSHVFPSIIQPLVNIKEDLSAEIVTTNYIILLSYRWPATDFQPTLMFIIMISTGETHVVYTYDFV